MFQFSVAVMDVVVKTNEKLEIELLVGFSVDEGTLCIHYIYI